MALEPDPLPYVEILEALRTFLTTVADGDYKVRHYRERETDDEELPCQTIRFISDDISSSYTGDDTGESLAVTVMDLDLSLISEGKVPAEATGIDPTGLALLTTPNKRAIAALMPEGEDNQTLGGRVWMIIYNGAGNDEDQITPDAGSVAERLTLRYRVRAEAPTVLLTGD